MLKLLIEQALFPGMCNLLKENKYVSCSLYFAALLITLVIYMNYFQ